MCKLMLAVQAGRNAMLRYMQKANNLSREACLVEVAKRHVAEAQVEALFDAAIKSVNTAASLCISSMLVAYCLFISMP